MGPRGNALQTRGEMHDLLQTHTPQRHQRTGLPPSASTLQAEGDAPPYRLTQVT